MLVENNGLKIPDYLSPDFFAKVLKNGAKFAKPSIKSVSFTMGSSPGENYCSEIYRVRIQYESTESQGNKTISLIIKSMPFVIEKQPLFTVMKVYERELNVYFEILPKLQNLLPNEIFGPKCYFSTDNPIQTIVMEDMNEVGYCLGNREIGIDENHSKIVMRKLGKYHASTMVLFDKEPELAKHFSTGLLHPGAFKEPLFIQFFLASVQSLTESVKSWPGYENIYKKLTKICDSFFEIVEKTIDTKNDRVKVLNHGDTWINNILFKYDNGNPTDLVFIDHQMSFYASPGIDINYFLNTSPTLKVLQNKREILIDEYYKSFSETLKRLNQKNIPTLNDIKNEISKKEFYGLVASATVLPVVRLDRTSSKESNLEAFLDEKQAEINRKAMFSSKGYCETMKYILKRFDEIGVLDVC